MAWHRRYPVVFFTLGLSLMAAALAAISWSVLSGSWAPGPWLLCWLAALNLTSFVAYGLDKWQARRGGWRIPELTLLLVSFIGGSIGAWAAMVAFRHKTVKGRFRILFWLLVALQVVLVIWI